MAQSRAEPSFHPAHDGKPEGRAHVPELVWFARTAEGSGFGKRPRVRGEELPHPRGCLAPVCFGLGRYILVWGKKLKIKTNSAFLKS